MESCTDVFEGSYAGSFEGSCIDSIADSSVKAEVDLSVVNLSVFLCPASYQPSSLALP